MAIRIQLCVGAFALLVACAPEADLVEASGVAYANEVLLFVSDATTSDGHIFRVNVSDSTLPMQIGGAVEVEMSWGNWAADLESLDTFSDGRILAISERLRSLIVDGRVAAVYPDWMAEVGGRGIEGVAVSKNGKVAALWEGGFPDSRKLSPEYEPRAGRVAYKPLVCVHEYPPRQFEVCEDGTEVFALQVPIPPDTSQAFRAPDLVWTEDETEVIVLLTSTDAADGVFDYKWVQRFSVQGPTKGMPIGPPLNLCAPGLFGNAKGIRVGGATAAFEGLDWLNDTTLVLVNDVGTPTVVAVGIRPWPSTAPASVC